MDVDQLWKSTLGEIELDVSRGQYVSLFKDTRLIQNTDSSLTLLCPNNGSLMLLQARFSPLIKERLEAKTRQPVLLSFSVMPQNNIKQTPGPLFESQKTQTASVRDKGLNPRLTFSNFAVSDSNQMAFAAAQAVGGKLGRAYNPLFLWGAVGVGKTHLMQSIGIRALQNNPDLHSIYCTGEEFTNEIIEAIRARNTARFKKKYRSADLLMVDDIQFIAGRESVQMEFFHTFNAVMNVGGQVVLTSDKPPSHIEQLEKRLRSRFEGGLIIDIAPPNFELRTAILLIKAQERGIALPIEHAKSLAASIEDVRALEGSLLRYQSEQRNGNEADIALGRILTKTNNITSDKKKTDPQKIIEVIASHFSLTTTQIVGTSRKQQTAYARQLLMFVLRQDVGLSFSDIGSALGGRDHSTIIHGVDKIQGLLPKNENARRDCADIRRVLWG